MSVKTSKVVGSVVAQTPDNAQSFDKLSGYSVIGGSPTGVSMDKAAVYSVTGASGIGSSLDKLAVYSVLDSSNNLQIEKLYGYSVLDTHIAPLNMAKMGAASLDGVSGQALAKGMAITALGSAPSQFGKLAAYSLVEAVVQPERIGKMIAYSATGLAANADGLSKALGYSVTGVAEAGDGIAKMAAYSVTGLNDNGDGIAKMFGYSVLEETDKLMIADKVIGGSMLGAGGSTVAKVAGYSLINGVIDPLYASWVRAVTLVQLDDPSVSASKATALSLVGLGDTDLSVSKTPAYSAVFVADPHLAVSEAHAYTLVEPQAALAGLSKLVGQTVTGLAAPALGLDKILAYTLFLPTESIRASKTMGFTAASVGPSASASAKLVAFTLYSAFEPIRVSKLRGFSQAGVAATRSATAKVVAYSLCDSHITPINVSKISGQSLVTLAAPANLDKLVSLSHLAVGETVTATDKLVGYTLADTDFDPILLTKATGYSLIEGLNADGQPVESDNRVGFQIRGGTTTIRGRATMRIRHVGPTLGHFEYGSSGDLTP